jgi:Rps23 Pro-64 3,4-dihydroxylase Tpa1-like proline 4-hydroxylase
VNFSSRLHFPLENFIRNKLKTDFDPQVAFMSWTSHQFDLSYNLFSLDFTLSEKGLRVELVTSESRLRQKPIEILRENYSQINGKIKKYDVTNEFINYIEN